MDPRFAHIRDWIFDLDNCLYPASAGLFELIDERMGAYIQRLLDCDALEARRVQKAHFHEHGTTLAGLMKMGFGLGATRAWARCQRGRDGDEKALWE